MNEEWKEYVGYIWKIWNPDWQYSNDEFIEAERSFENPDWCKIVLHYYQMRWGFTETDPSYNDIEEKLKQNPTIDVTTLVIHGGGDPCNSPSTSEGKAVFFSNTYKRIVIDNVDHFPQREASHKVKKAILPFLV